VTASSAALAVSAALPRGGFFVSRPEILLAFTPVAPPEENYLDETLEKSVEPFDWNEDAN